MRQHIPPRMFFTISLLGIWLFTTPFTFGFQSKPLIYSNFICGILLFFLAETCRKNLKAIWVWAIVAIGIWLQATPLVFWAPEAAAYLNDTFVGVWLITLAITIHPLPGEFPAKQPTIPPGWSYNPSAWTQRVPIAFLAFACWMISRYLAAYQLGYIDTVWDPFFTPGTKSVLESDVSRAFPVSDAGLGALAYTMEFFSACQGSENRWRTAPWLVLVFGILVIPVSLVSTILIILQPLAVGTWCTLCLITAACMLIGIPFAIGEVAATIQYLRLASKTQPPLSVLFRGGPSPKETVDKQTPPIDCSFLAILRSSLSGITFPWNLFLGIFLGIFLMAIPSLFGLQGILFDLDPILGALTTIVFVVSLAEYMRKIRRLNFFLAAAIMIIALFSRESAEIIFLHLGFASAIAALSVRQGPIREQFKMEKL